MVSRISRALLSSGWGAINSARTHMGCCGNDTVLGIGLTEGVGELARTGEDVEEDCANKSGT